MKPSKILALSTLYYEELVARGGTGPRKMPEDTYVDLTNQGDWNVFRNHCAWACTYIKELVEAEEYATAQQWLGWVQGSMVAMGIYTIEEERAHDVPNGYDPVGGGGGSGHSDLPAGSRGED